MITVNSLIEILRNNREVINIHIQRYIQKYPSFDLDTVKHGFKNVFEPLIKAIEKIEPDKTENVFKIVLDLFLIAVAKRYYVVHERQVTRTRLELLFEKLLLLVPEIVVEKPLLFIGKLFNAGEYLRGRSTDFFNNLIKVASFITLDNFLDIGGIIAWSVGEAQLREHSLSVLNKLPPEFLLKLADLNDTNPLYIKNVADIIINTLKNNKWKSIEKPFSINFKNIIQTEQEISEKLINEEIKQTNLLGKNPIIILNDIGGFTGFGGNFSSPTRLIWGPNKTIVAYTEFGEIIIINIDGNGYKEKKIHAKDLQVLVFHPKMGFVNVKKNGKIINLSTLTEYPEIIKDTENLFSSCSTYATAKFVYIFFKNQIIYRINSEKIEKFDININFKNFTITDDDRFFFINLVKGDKSTKKYYVAELFLNGKYKNLIEVAADGSLTVIDHYIYIFKEPDNLLIYDLKDPNNLIKQKLPIKMENCSSLLINENEIYISSKFSHHIIIFGPDPYLP